MKNKFTEKKYNGYTYYSLILTVLMIAGIFYHYNSVEKYEETIQTCKNDIADHMNRESQHLEMLKRSKRKD